VEGMWEGRDADVIWEGICRLAAVILTVSMMVLVLLSFVALLVRGALHLQMGWPAYQEGMKRWVEWFDTLANAVTKGMSLDQNIQLRAKAVYNYALATLQDLIYGSVNWLISSISTSVSTLIVVILYVLFGLSRPLPMGGTAGALVRSYIWKKSLVSLLYGACVTLLFLLLSNDLAFFFGMVSFFLNYVPEVGAIFSMMVPVPVILLDGRLTSPILVLTISIIGQLLLKLAFSNILEMKLVEQDREMSIHPVWVLLGLNYFGYIWGPVGMLISVPVLALMKSAALSSLLSEDGLSRSWAPNFLACLEGRPGAWAAGRRPRFISAHPELSASMTLPAPCRPSSPRVPAGAAVANFGADAAFTSGGDADESENSGTRSRSATPRTRPRYNPQGPVFTGRGSPSPSPPRRRSGASSREGSQPAHNDEPEALAETECRGRQRGESTPTLEESRFQVLEEEVPEAPVGG